MKEKYRKVNPAPCDVLPEPHFLQGICEQGHRKMESEFRQSPYRAIRAARLKGHSSEAIPATNDRTWAVRRAQTNSAEPCFFIQKFVLLPRQNAFSPIPVKKVCYKIQHC